MIGWTEERTALLRQLWQTHCIADIAEIMGIPMNAARSKAFKIGLRDPVPPPAPPAPPPPVAPPPSPPPIRCPGYTHDYRFQLGPRENPPALFSAVRPGQDLDGRPWGAVS